MTEEYVQDFDGEKVDEKTMEKLMSAEDIDDSALEENNRRVIALAEKCEHAKTLRQSKLTILERRQIAQEIEENGIVLLKNNGILPLRDRETDIPIAGNAAEQYYRGGGSSEVKPEIPYEKLLSISLQ